MPPTSPGAAGPAGLGADLLGDDRERPTSRGVRPAAAVLLVLLAALAFRAASGGEAAPVPVLPPTRAPTHVPIRAPAVPSLTVVHAGTLPAVSTPGAQRQTARVELIIHNGSPVTVTLLGARVDGDGPEALTGSVGIPAGTDVGLTARWTVLCAEVGGPGPRALHVRVRGGGAVAAARLRLSAAPLVRTTHAAAVDACAALLPTLTARPSR